MENTKPVTITITELVRGGRAVTAASSLHCFSTSSTPWSSSEQDRQNPQLHHGLTDSTPKPKVLTPLNHSAILIGTLTLPTTTLKCPNRNCFQFSDDSSTVCCDVLDFDVRLVGSRVFVLAWNFVPMKHYGGFLEIVKWKLPDSGNAMRTCPSPDSFPLVSGALSGNLGDPKSRYSVSGVLESISPVIIVPCSIDTGNNGLNSSGVSNIRGFLVRIMACECKQCRSKEPIPSLGDQSSGLDGHSFARPVFVYFLGSASYWHAVITKLVGDVVTLSRMKKKLIFIGKEESQLMFVTAHDSVLSLPRLSKKRKRSSKNVVKGKGECGVYTGVVKGVYLKGMLVELDNEVWLLLTDMPFAPPHSLREGAIISARNVHFVNPKFRWAKMLILGACCKTSITVMAFSPFETGCHVASSSSSLLGKFVDSLAFSARFWALLVITCLRKKFTGIVSEKEILGSKHKEGVAKKYADTHLTSSMFQPRLGVFQEFCRHELCGCNKEAHLCDLKLVVPISCFIQHLEARIRSISRDYNCVRQSSESQRGGQTERKNFVSEDLGLILLGTVKISPSSKRLQLVDSSGSIDIVVPDLPSNWNLNKIYEVVDYSLTIEDMPEVISQLGILNKSFSCRSIFQCAPPMVQTKPMFLYFCLSAASSRNAPLCHSLCSNDDCKELDGSFHLFRVTHKFPALQNFRGDLKVYKTPKVFVEVVILPWNLVIARKDGIVQLGKISRDPPMESMKNSAKKSQEHPPSKRLQSVDSARRNLVSGCMSDMEDFRTTPNTSSTLKNFHEDCRFLNRSTSDGVACTVTIKTVDKHSLVASGVLYHAEVNRKADVKNKSSGKVLLEVNIEDLSIYYVGCYYIMKCSEDDSLSKIKSSVRVNCHKVPFSPKTRIWSLHFSFNEELSNTELWHDHSGQDFSLKYNRVLPVEEAKVEGFSRSSKNADVLIHLPSDLSGVLGGTLKKLKEDLTKSAVNSEEIVQGMPRVSSHSSFLFPEGNLVSLRGDIVAITSLDFCPPGVHSFLENPVDSHKSEFNQGGSNNICIRVLVNYQTVNIFGSLSRLTYVTGLGPGVNATFYRVLKLGGDNMLLMPVSFITINNVRVIQEPYKEHPGSWPASYVHCTTSQESICAGLISELIRQSLELKPIRLLCRVVAVHILVLEKNADTYSKVEPRGPHGIYIPLAGLVIDDGSSSCCCWANTERAASLLLLHEKIPHKTFHHTKGMLKSNRQDNYLLGTTMHRLGRILKNHNRIVVKNYGSKLDSSFQDIMVSVSSGNTLSGSDENFLKSVILNACFSRLWTIVASKMDSNRVIELGRENLVQTEMAMHSMENVWATDVCQADPLNEARSMIQELLNT